MTPTTIRLMAGALGAALAFSGALAYAIIPDWPGALQGLAVTFLCVAVLFDEG